MAHAFRTTRAAAALSLALAGAGITATGCGLFGRAPDNHTLMYNADQPSGGTGAVDRTELLVAWYASQEFHDQLDTLRTHLEAAPDADKPAIEGRGPETQAIAHRQLAGDEPLYTVLVGVQDELDALMDEQGLWKVVLVSGDAPAGTTDITDELVSRITPHEQHEGDAEGGE